MNQKRLSEEFEVAWQEIKALRAAGQKEYAHDLGNAFGNFTRLASELGLSQEKVLWVFAKKHIDGIVAYINGHRSQRESVKGRINDLIVYMLILRGMVVEREEDDALCDTVKPEYISKYRAAITGERVSCEERDDITEDARLSDDLVGFVHDLGPQRARRSTGSLRSTGYGRPNPDLDRD